MFTKIWRKSLKLKDNKGGIAIADNVIGMLIMIAILSISLGVLASGAMAKLNETKTQTAMTDMGDTISMVFYDHPGFASDIGLTYTASSGVYSAIDANASKKAIDIINTYLGESNRFDTKGQSFAVDAWKSNFEIYFSATDLDIDTTNKTVTKVTTNSRDTEFRIIIKSLGKNKTVARDTSVTAFPAAGQKLDDKDDIIFIIQCINGDVKTATYGAKTNRGNVYFVSNTNGARALDEVYIL